MNSFAVNTPVTVSLPVFKQKVESCKKEIIRYLVLLKYAANQLANYTDEYTCGNISEVTYKAKVNQLADLLCTSTSTINLFENVKINYGEGITSKMMLLEIDYDYYINDIVHLNDECFNVGCDLLDCECQRVDIYTEFVLNATDRIYNILPDYTKKYDFVRKQFDIIDKFSELPFHDSTQ